MVNLIQQLRSKSRTNPEINWDQLLIHHWLVISYRVIENNDGFPQGGSSSWIDAPPIPGPKHRLCWHIQ